MNNSSAEQGSLARRQRFEQAHALPRLSPRKVFRQLRIEHRCNLSRVDEWEEEHQERSRPAAATIAAASIPNAARRVYCYKKSVRG